MVVFSMPHVRPLPRILATELEENIIFYLQDDVNMLRICALVCRAWRIVSRIYLFASIRVLGMKSLDELCAHFEVNPHFASTVKSMRINPIFDDRITGPPILSNGSHLIFTPLLCRLTSCRHLHLKGEEHFSFSLSTLR